MNELHPTFPGGMRPSGSGYECFLVGDLFESRHLRPSLALYAKAEAASRSLGQFSLLIEQSPNPADFIQAHSHQEATQSSRIEGTHTRLQEAFLDERHIEPERRHDWREVRCHIQAMQDAVRDMEKLPLCIRLLKQAHQTLLSQARGRGKAPGEFRRSQNWIGGANPATARFVPPAAGHVENAMSNLELFMQDDTLQMPHLIKAALLHYQFETIHPFLDGNGRVGRMLITLYLLDRKLLEHPILSISNFFEAHRGAYYDALSRARESRDGLLAWVEFFMDAVYTVAEDGIAVTQNLIALKEALRDTCSREFHRPQNAHRLLEVLFAAPSIDAPRVQKTLQLSPQAAQNLLKKFVELGMLHEITGYKRNRLYVFQSYIRALRPQMFKQYAAARDD